MRPPKSLLCLALSILPTAVLAVFADEAGVVDYHYELLGLPKPDTTFFYRPRKEDKASLLYSLSDLGVVGAVNPGTGAPVWRQVLGSGSDSLSNGLLRGVDGDGVVVSALGKTVSAWDAISGRLKWQSEFSGQVKDLEVMESAIVSAEAKDVLALYEDGNKGILRRLTGNGGDLKWEFTDEASGVPFQISTSPKDVFVISLHAAGAGYNLKVTTLDPVTGKKVDEYTLSSKSEIYNIEDILLVGASSAAPILAWTDQAKQEVKVNILGKKAVQNLALKEADGKLTKVTLHAPHLSQSQPHFLVFSQSASANRADVYHIDLKSNAITKAYELPKLEGTGTISTSSQDGNVFFTRMAQGEAILVSSASHGILGRWPLKIDESHGSLLHAASEVVARSADTYAVRSAVATSNEDWVMIRNGAESWTRVEGLSGAIIADWAELPGEEQLAATLKAEAQTNPLASYLHRWQRHIQELEHLPAYLTELPKRVMSSILPVESVTSDDLVRDNFGFHKMVIVATQRGRLYGLNAGNKGKVVWSAKAYDIPDDSKWDVKGIWVDNVKGLVNVRGATGEYVLIKALTGQIIEKTSPGSWPPVTSSVVIDSASGKWYLPIGVDGNPGDIPSAWAPKDVLVVQGANGEVRGLKYMEDGANSVPTAAWTFQPTGEKIINVVAKPAHDPVASIGRVLGDRTVLYKYLNPNTILVTAISETGSSLSMYLLDSVSGDILYSTSHSGVDTKQPIASILTENWFAYSMFGDSAPGTTEEALPLSKGYQLVVTELFESELANDRGPLGSMSNTSSLEPLDIPNAEPAIPHAVTQTFLIPEAISHMSVSETKQGITTRQLLCTLPASNSIVGILYHIINPRRPVGRDPTPVEVEEGLFRYTPFIDFDPKMIVTHKLNVIGIKGVITSPALLESTSLVFAYGIDIFGTRVVPSMAFDILGKGFNRLNLVATVLALQVGVMVLAPMVRRKQINGRWMTS
ncbi:DUF1605-containing protein [Coleophoma cylindrospora]|uniref:ER membrane protein complex subunit 1 n=1 Tax=Coleophoma cylindrospora TaxID=1849047 RepID=A0A3D8QL19_9HELO|nr:DUF1605-containing protein [Coleophoma cylindrospora]